MGSDGLIIDGQRYPVPGVRVVTWEDDARVPKAVHGETRDSADVTGSVAHTSRGKRYSVTRETGSPAKGLRVARYLGRRNRKGVSAHVSIASDGTVYQMADLARWKCNHAGPVNGFTFGVEVAQDDNDPSLTRAQVAAFVALMTAAHDAMGIPKTIPMEHGKHVVDDVRAWLSLKSGGEQLAFRGCVGHRCTSASRGEGDPGTPLMEALRLAGFVGITPASMTHGANFAALTAEDEADETHDEDDASAVPLPPPWLDPAREIDARRDLPDDLAAFVRAQWPVLRDMGLAREQAAEFIAHAATECGRGRRAIAHNLGGVKAKEREYREAAAKGVALTWWRDLGHVESGDDEVEYYRGFADDAEFWRYFAKRFAPRNADASERYAAAGNVFWSDVPELWFPAIVRAGYRGDVRRREIAALADPETHPSVAAHRALAAKARGML